MQREVAPDCGFSSCSVDSLHSGPDIEDLARRSGLPRSISPYRLGSFNGRLFIEASGHSTATVNSFVLFGFSKDVHDARAFSRRFPESLDPVLLREKFRNLRWLPDHWLQTAIINAAEATDHEQRAKELILKLLEEVPELRGWPPSMLDNRPNLVKKGEIAHELQEELKKINNFCRPKSISESELRSQFPMFTVWQRLEELNPAQKATFAKTFDSRGRWKMDQIRDCIGVLMRGGARETVRKWIKDFHTWKKKMLQP